MNVVLRRVANTLGHWNPLNSSLVSGKMRQEHTLKRLLVDFSTHRAMGALDTHINKVLDYFVVSASVNNSIGIWKWLGV